MSGGIGVSKSITVGSNVNMNGALNFGGTSGGLKEYMGVNTTNDKQLYVTDTSYTSTATNPVMRIGFTNSNAYLGTRSTDGTTTSRSRFWLPI